VVSWLVYAAMVVCFSVSSIYLVPILRGVKGTKMHEVKNSAITTLLALEKILLFAIMFMASVKLLV